MTAKFALLAGSLLGALGVGLGAFGAHRVAMPKLHIAAGADRYAPDPKQPKGSKDDDDESQDIGAHLHCRRMHAKHLA